MSKIEVSRDLWNDVKAFLVDMRNGSTDTFYLRQQAGRLLARMGVGDPNDIHAQQIIRGEEYKVRT